jgi:hypothetical protein
MSDANTFAGDWYTTFGLLSFEVDGDNVVGVYRYANGVTGRISGTHRGDTLHFRYSEPNEEGVGTFRLLRSGKFVGKYTPTGTERTRRWDGERGWDGVWQSDFGRVRLIQHGERVHGYYEGAGASTIEGRSNGRTLDFRFREANSEGDGRFTLSDDGYAFSGEWRSLRYPDWSRWNGARTYAERGVIWLIVLEAHWQRSVAENEYAYGHMLREVFARLAHVRVRQRFFHDAESLEHWCRELLYLREPAILMIASHGVEQGLSVHGEIINTTRILDSLRHAEDLALLHFSSCLVGCDGENALQKQAYPVSGYTTSVDWGASALLEFTYLDLILNRGMTPAEAAAKLPTLISYSGDSVSAESPYPAAGFRFFAAR